MAIQLRLLIVAVLLLTVTASYCQADDLDNLVDQIFRVANVDSAGVPGCSREDVDSLVQLICGEFHRNYRDAFIARDTIAMVHRQSFYSLSANAVPGADTTPITFCMAFEHRTLNDSTLAGRLMFPIQPVAASRLQLMVEEVPGAAKSNSKLHSRYVAITGSDLILHPAPRFDEDSIIVEYHATQDSLVADQDFLINSTYRSEFVHAVAALVIKKLAH